MPAASTPSRRNLKGKHILVVEDYELMGKILVNLLKQYDHASYARSGMEALQEIDRKPPDLILLDLILPDMSGLEVARAVRQNKKTNSTPILAMSGSPAEKPKCLEAGCNDFILKPFDISKLLDRLAVLLAS
jgi:DNA-binding response OmpR family regulator